MHVLLSVISCSQVETIVQIFAHVGVEPHAAFNVGNTELFLTIPHPRADLFLANGPSWGRRSEKCPTNARGGMGGLGIDRAIIATTNAP